ncbi:UpxY family transcription antiterminator [Flavobacterium sp. N502536]|uniref:UpxY family transcription antiterminator n=1 Tax=unclassified Flavobacterium TaxID=196869 RepID=UPI0022217412|nr:UpxY family transcription antiterminator [Flavobacterium sp. N502536]
MKSIHNGWYVLYVKCHHERKVFDGLGHLSIRAFLPTIEVPSKRTDRKKSIQKLLFPSYVFVKINSSLEFYKTLSVNGACMYIRFGMEYAKVSDDEMRKIELLLLNNDVTEIETHVEEFKVGDFKTISYGSLSGLECEVLNTNNTNKIVVRIDSLQKNITATIPSYYLQN